MFKGRNLLNARTQLQIISSRVIILQLNSNITVCGNLFYHIMAILQDEFKT